MSFPNVCGGIRSSVSGNTPLAPPLHHALDPPGAAVQDYKSLPIWWV